MITHKYAADGPYQVSLRVLDATNRESTFNDRVLLNDLRIVASFPVPTADGRLRSSITLTSGHSPLSDAVLQMSDDFLGANVLHTDTHGRVLIEGSWGTFAGNIARTDHSVTSSHPCENREPTATLG